MTREQEVLLYLVRLGIGGDVEPDFVLDGVDWRELVELSYRQGVAAIAVDGLQKVYESNPSLELALDSPELEAVKYEWFGVIFDTESRSRNVSDRARELYSFFAKAGFRSCLLKGQGVAQLYPVPSHRTPGDIDLWVEGGRDDVLDYVISKGVKIGNVDSKHCDAEFFGDVSVEIHSLPSYSFDPLCWWRLKRWASQQVGIQASLFDPGVGFAYPSMDFNLVYILHHIYRHIFIEGVGLRQVTDYACVLRHSAKADRKAVWQMVCSFKMKRFAAGMMWVMRECFHIDDSLLLCAPSESEGRFLLNEFWYGGGFGRYDSRYTLDYSGSTLRLGVSQFRRNLSFLAHYPNEVLWSPFWKLWHWCWMKNYAQKLSKKC